MGIAAAAAAATIAGAAVTAGTSIYGAVSAGDGPAAAGGAFNSALKKLANQYLAPFMDQGQWDVNAMMPQWARQSTQMVGQFNQAAQQQLSQLLNQAVPGYQNMMNQAGVNTAALLRGEIPTDVQNQIERSAAFGAMRGGFAGTAAGGALTARDLGLTSLQLQGQGQQQLGNLLQLARGYTMPQMLSPMALLSTFLGNDQWSKVQRYNATMNYVNMRTSGAAAQLGAPNQSAIPAIGQAISGLTGSLTGTNQQTGQSALGTLWNWFQNRGGFTGDQMAAMSGGDTSFYPPGSTGWQSGQSGFVMVPTSG